MPLIQVVLNSIIANILNTNGVILISYIILSINIFQDLIVNAQNPKLP